MSETIFNIGIKGVIEKDDRILMLRKAGDKGFWEVPGGRIDGDESIEEALHRELREELPGVENVQIGELLHAERLPGLRLGDKGLFLLWYGVDADFPQGVKLSAEHDAYAWSTQDEVEAVASDGVKKAVRKLRFKN